MNKPKIYGMLFAACLNLILKYNPDAYKTLRKWMKNYFVWMDLLSVDTPTYRKCRFLIVACWATQKLIIYNFTYKFYDSWLPGRVGGLVIISFFLIT